MGKLTLTVVKDPEPDPAIDQLLDALCELSRRADTVELWIGV